MPPSVIVTGVPRSPLQGNATPVRLEINDFIKDDIYLSLYIQALQELFEKDQNDTLSWFQLAGIHGLPHVSWDNSPGGDSGYCQHGTVLFPTWHRPYVALVEQAIQATAVKIASRYTTNKEQWQRSANSLRQPYWDWAANPVLPDQIILQETLPITTPQGLKSVPNPFFCYRFHPISKSFPSDADKYPTTLRYPTTHDSGAKTDVESLKRALQNTHLSRDAYNLFMIPTWNLFSNRRGGGHSQGGHSNSLEAIHDIIHTTVGGLTYGHGGPLVGHMSDPSVAAFDPVFWLHHSQVDRLLCMWAAFHPDSWVSDPDLHKDLFPFWNTKTSFWKSSNCSYTDVDLNYTYPDFADGATLKDLADSIKTVHAPAGMIKMSTGIFYQWTARVRCNKYELGGRSFAIYFFLGQIPQDQNEWASSENVIGVFSAFVNAAADQCANCRETAQDGIQGFVHLDDGISKHAGLDSFDEEVIKPYLRNNLRWGVIGHGALEDLKSLEITVLRTPLTFNEGAHFPSVGEPVYYHEITVGIPGGSRA